MADADLFSYLERNIEKALIRDTAVIERLVCDSVMIKSAIVNRDEREKGERRKLNLGHTFGHAVERAASIPHGEAVSVGMVAAAELSHKRGSLPAKDVERIEELLKQLGLPTRIQIDGNRVIGALRKDKKRKGDAIHFVFLHGIGNAVVEEVSTSELEALAWDLF
jgi:3-dehydroquinate synthase